MFDANRNGLCEVNFKCQIKWNDEYPRTFSHRSPLPPTFGGGGTFIHFDTFLCRSLETYNVKWPNSKFYGETEWTQGGAFSFVLLYVQSCPGRRRAGHPTLNVPAHDMWQRHVTGTKSRNVHTEGTSSRDRFTICIYIKNEAEIAATSPPCEQVHDLLFDDVLITVIQSIHSLLPCYLSPQCEHYVSLSKLRCPRATYAISRQISHKIWKALLSGVARYSSCPRLRRLRGPDAWD